MKKILFLTNIIRQLTMMRTTMEELQTRVQISPACECIYITDDTEWNAQWRTKISSSQFVMVKWMGTGLDTTFLKTLLAILKQYSIPYYIDATGSSDDELVAQLSEQEAQQIRSYCLYSGERNYLNLWLYLQYKDSGKNTLYSEAQPVLWSGIYHPRATKVYTQTNEYLQDFCDNDKPFVGLLIYRNDWIWGDLEYPSAIIQEIERQNMNAVCVFSNSVYDPSLNMPRLTEVFAQYFTLNGTAIIDVLINTIKFSMTAGGSLSLDFLKRFNIPVLQAYALMTPYAEWCDNLEGMNPMEISISISLPEFDGIVHGLPVATRQTMANGDIRYKPIAERIRSMVRKSFKWAKLRHKSNEHKKIAIIFHNYPPRNSNIGSAVGLDTIESIRRVLAMMRARGYKVDSIPADGKSFIQELTANATNDRSMLTEQQLAAAQKLSGSEYCSFFATLPATVQDQLVKDWGIAPGEVMNYDGDLLIPGTLNGNVFITVQPPRGFGEDPDKIYHSPFTAPTHQYLGFYKWLRDIWQADAVAHIGTHGSLEWLPGKNAGLSDSCYPDLALGDLPNIYPYLITITGEGIQAKRRGAACLIEHLPPRQQQAGLYDELSELEKHMEEYLHFTTNNPEALPALQEVILAKAKQANLDNEVPYQLQDDFSTYIEQLHLYITDLKNMQVRVGLHILGEAPADEALRDYLWLLTRLDNGAIPSLLQSIAATYGLDFNDLLDNSAYIHPELQISYAMLADRINTQAYNILDILAANNYHPEAIANILHLDWLATSTEEQRSQLLQICEYVCTNIYPNLMLTTQETENMLRGFEGQYIEPGPSGAPSSGGADLLPTGRNFYGVDPRTLPTPAAWENGKNLGEQVISRFILEEGHYPESVGIILWSGSNMRSHGQCVAEFLYLLGVKPKWQAGSLRVIGLEVIPLSELQRPRIDVTARISGLFRDSMPALMELMDKAVLLVSQLEETDEDNYIRKHVRTESAELQAEGMNKEEAWRQAAFRIFGDELGVYGAGVAALLEAKNWESIDDLADVYVRWGAHAYGGSTRGQFVPNQFRRRMATMDVTIKNEDNHETNMLSSDDYNAYHGGMIAAVRSIKGSAPRSYCGDSTDKSKVVMHSVQEQAKRIFRSEAINPKFIKGMMQHGYKGAADLANYIAHSFQWDATSKVMEDWMYEKYAEKYAFDPAVQQWLREVNPWALQRMTEILLEAEQRQLWNANPETKAKLQELYLSIEGELEENT